MLLMAPEFSMRTSVRSRTIPDETGAQKKGALNRESRGVLGELSATRENWTSDELGPSIPNAVAAFSASRTLSFPEMRSCAGAIYFGDGGAYGVSGRFGL